MHGRDHRPGGEDPIPGIGGGGTVWAKASMASATTIAGSGTTKELSMNTTVDYTNDASVFSMGQHGSGSWGIAIAAQGHYLLKGQLALTAIASTGQISAVFINYSPDVTPSAYGSEGRFWTRQTGDSTEDGWYLETIVTVDNGGPSTEPLLWEVTNSTGGTLQAYIDIAVFQLDTDDTVFF